MARIVSSLLIAFALAFAQAAGFAHAYGHFQKVSQSKYDEATLGQDQPCNWCAAFETASSGAAVHVSAAVDAAPPEVHFDWTFESASVGVFLPYSSRAPPGLGLS